MVLIHSYMYYISVTIVCLASLVAAGSTHDSLVNESDKSVSSSNAHVDILIDLYRNDIVETLNGSSVVFNSTYCNLQIKYSRKSMQTFALCTDSNLLHTITNEQNSVSKLDFFHGLSSETQKFNFYPRFNISKILAKKELLIVLTTCNQLKMTILALDYLKETQWDADILVVDDHSVDGTVDYLIKKGYAVIAKERAQGLTDSWNRGYEIAVALGYKSLIFTNNDVLVTAAGVRIIRQELRREVVVVPLTSAKGAGHNPAQSLVRAYHLPEAMEDYVSNPRHLELIQSALSRIARNISAVRDPSDRRKRFARLVPSVFHGKARFNGFFFGVNLALIAPVAVRHSVELFDSRDLMVGQEDHLMARLATLNMVPKIAMCAYMFHFKSVTVASANIKTIHSYDNDAVKYSRTSRKFNVKKEKRTANGTMSTVMDIRDDLRFYHPEFITADRANATRTGAASMQHDQLVYPELYRSYSLLSTRDDITVYPQPQDMMDWLRARIARNLEKDQQDKADSNDSNEVLLLDTLKSKQQMTQLEREIINKAKVVIAFAISDPKRTPAAGDIFTAQELGAALTLNYNVDVRYLHRGSEWYSPSMLSDVDVLIAMLDAYDLGRAVSAVQRDVVDKTPYETLINRRRGVKPTLVTVAWMRNWFQRWLTRPWLGNYDLLLVSSVSAERFFNQVGSIIGFPVQCVVGCPQIHGVAESVNKTAVFEFSLVSRRVQVPVKVLPLATNSRVFGAKATSKSWKNNSKYSADYAFSGSYHGTYREIMRFDPGALLPEYKGLIVGDGWERRVGGPNVSAEWHRIAIGRVPYEEMSQLYHGVKIVIDDANHVTKPWGSVNSRVFDALCAGALVVTNGVRGFEEVFGSVMKEIDGSPLRVPLYYSTGKDLEDVLRYYLSQPQERQRLITAMQTVVLIKHTYSARAMHLADTLSSYGMKLHGASDKTMSQFVAKSRTRKLKKQQLRRTRHAKRTVGSKKSSVNSLALPQQRSSMCVGIRTVESQLGWVEILVRSLMMQYLGSPFSTQVDMQIFVVNTDQDTASLRFHTKLVRFAKTVNSEFGIKVVHIFSDVSANHRAYRNPFYGYDSTDLLVAHMLRLNAQNVVTNDVSVSPACEWIMLTNGDNTYNAAWFNTIAPRLLNPTLEAVAWDYVTHHKRGKDLNTETAISVQLKRGFVDLGSMAIRSRRYAQSQALFLADSIFTPDIFARDYFTFKTALSGVSENAIAIIHHCLLLHQ